ncbi:hypothetical protein SLEP1_g37630 [Rubroshorea leprosula]|uniref:Ribosomal protein S9 n=1 Tax=Rubroshorea leprosula TaxID=152421 RepID=A0AAV5KVG2_9ROSI|nr:hypothetical protein SLEP1_g37630 [Rubroshorea leprosula]
MLGRLLPKPSHFRLLTLISSTTQAFPRSTQSPHFPSLLRYLSSNHNNNNGKDPSFPNIWKLSQEGEEKFDSLFSEDSANLSGITETDSSTSREDSWVNDTVGDEGNVFDGIESTVKEESWVNARGGDEGDVFKGIEEGGEKSGERDLLTAEGDKPWSLGEEEKDIFNFGEVEKDVGIAKAEITDEESEAEKQMKLEKEEKQLTATVKGPNRAFGDLITASGITDAMLDSLIALRDLEGVDGLPPLREIEDMRYEKNTRKSTRAEIELLKQEEAAKARVRQVDDKGRAYGTGKRKCSIARVWIQPGDGKFIINDKQFDVYFPMLDHRAALLRPFSETKTLGLWDIHCTVKGGGVSGQVGAIQLGISRALQNWEPDLRSPLRAGGFLTRDPRVVERKKPGKAKARKSFQWVKR